MRPRISQELAESIARRAHSHSMVLSKERWNISTFFWPFARRWHAFEKEWKIITNIKDDLSCSITNNERLKPLVRSKTF